MNTELASKIKKLKPGPGFIVPDHKERSRAIKEARDLKRAGIISFEVSTRELEDGTFKVFAV